MRSQDAVRQPLATLRAPLVAAALVATAAPAAAQSASFVNWESPQSHPIDVTPDGRLLLAVNTADARLEVYDVSGGVPVRRGSVPVGLDPVSVRARTNGEAWVVNQISDSVSIVDLSSMHVRRTLLVGDEPADVAFAGSPQRAFVSLSIPERVVATDAANPGALASIAIAGSQPRAMCASPDGSRVYLAIFESGNRSTALPLATVSLASGPYAGQNPPPNAGTAFSPAKSASNGPAPRVGQIVRKNAAGQWLDGNGRNWTNFVTWDLHDHDVAVIDAATNAVTYVTGLMNIVSGIGTTPSGDVVAVGLESRNDLRFEQNLNGVFVKCVAARLPGGAGPGSVVDMNPHLTYAAPTTSVVSRLQSVGDPRGVAAGSDGRTWTAGLGSNSVIAFDASGARQATVTVGEGPSGLVLSPDGSRLFVLNRFEGSVSAVSTATNSEVARVAFHDPTPAAVKAGRRFLYDTHLTSGLGQASCASCHVDGRSDRMSWDLGNPQGAIQLFDETCQAPNGCINWHPMKGPLTTQTLVGIIGNEPFHWRGEKDNLEEFNEAYVALQGRESEITAAEMAALHDYLESLTFGPNPNRNIDNTLRTSVPIAGGVVTGAGGTGNAVAGQNVFNTARIFGAPPGLTCLDCHSGPAGTNNRVDIPAPGGAEPQNRKNSPLRDIYRKVGANKASQSCNRGFGFDHGGDEFTLQDLLSIGFRFNTLPGGGTQQRRDVEAFCLSFGTDTHAGAGQQATAANAGGAGDDATRIAQLVNIAGAQASQVGLVAKGVRAGVMRGWVLQAGAFVPDRADEVPMSPAALLASATPGQETTYTLVPAGVARRLGIDRDGDTHLDRDEIDAGSDPADPGSMPGACPADLSGDGAVDGTDLGVMLASWGLAGETDLTGDGQTDGADLGALLAAWGACGG
jgi:YVTN family beta-propeller protein